MRRKVILLMLILLGFILLSSRLMIAAETEEIVSPEGLQALSLREFIDLSVQMDTEFEKILIDNLALKYAKDLGLPARDIVLSVKGQNNFILNQDRAEPSATVSLSKLFPFSGTSIGAEYNTSPTYASRDNSSDFTLEISQPIAENAFGKAARLKDKIIGVEINVAEHQIVEAYEDYLATIIVSYYDWYEAYENLKVSESSYQQNVKLLDNIEQRHKSNIALPIDVNKVHLQVLAKKEKLVQLKEEYESALNLIKTAIRYKGEEELTPEVPDLYSELVINFENDFEEAKEKSRTYKLLKLLEEKSQLRVDEEADDLLPSIDLLFGYNVKGKDWSIRADDNMVYAGVTLDWPFPDQVDRAEYETVKISADKTKLSNTSIYFQLYTEIKNLSIQLESEQELFDIAKEKIGLAKSILEDETENYSFGKVTLNDYIDSVNVVDTNRFNEILHEVQYKKLVIEWLRITDQLVSNKDINL